MWCWRGSDGAPVPGQSSLDAAGLEARSAGGQDIRHVRSRTCAAHHESFREQLLVCQHDDGSGNVQLFSQLSRRGQAFGIAHDAAQDRLAEPEIDLARKRLLAVQKWYGE